MLSVGCHTRNLRSALKATLGAGLAAMGLTATADFIIAAISVTCEGLDESLNTHQESEGTTVSDDPKLLYQAWSTGRKFCPVLPVFSV